MVSVPGELRESRCNADDPVMIGEFQSFGFHHPVPVPSLFVRLDRQEVQNWKTFAGWHDFRKEHADFCQARLKLGIDDVRANAIGVARCHADLLVRCNLLGTITL